MGKNILLILISIFTIQCNAQINSIDYFGQVPPGTSPKKFAPGFISKDGRYELMTAFSNDGKEFCFSVTDKEWSHFEIWYTKYDSNKWSEPQIIQLGSTGGFGAVFSPGDDTLFFSAGHWGKPPTADICFSKRTQTDWYPNPKRLDEFSPS